MSAPRKIIIDTDPGVDDVLAILLALSSPEVEVALLTACFGNTEVAKTYANIWKIYYNLNRELNAVPGAKERYRRVSPSSKTTVAIGSDYPLGGEKHVATYFHGPDGLSNISQTHPEFTPPIDDPETLQYFHISEREAHHEILDLLRSEPENTVTIVALGPLTNVAKAMQEDRQTFERVAEVVWMGGALDVPGNTSPVAEFNCFADPYAFEAVLEQVKGGGFRFTFAPLDITTPHTIPFTDLLYPGLIPGADATAFPAPSPLQAFTTSFLLRVREIQAKFGASDAMEMHDPVAVWYAIANAGRPELSTLSPGWGVARRPFVVERRGEITRGMCVVDRRGTGEETGIRTENDDLKRTGLQGLGNCAEEPASEEPAAEDVSEPEATSSEQGLPLVINLTPGTHELRRLLLGRVFGHQVEA